MSYILPYIHIFAAFIYITLAVYVLQRDHHSTKNRLATFLFSLFALWSITESFATNPFTSKSNALIMEQIGSICWLSFISVYFWFTLVFTEQKKKYLKLPIVLSLFIIPIVLFFAELNGLLLINHTKQTYGYLGEWSNSVWSKIYFSYILIFSMFAFFLLIKFAIHTKNRSKKKAVYIIFASSVATVLIGVSNNILLRSLGFVEIPPLGNVFTMILLCAFAYSVTHFNALDITPTAAANKIVSTMAEMLILTDVYQVIVSVNKSVTDYTGYSKDEIIGKPITNFLNDSNMENLLELVLNESIAAKERRTEIKCKNGSLIPIQFTASSVKRTGLACIARDIRGIIQTEELLKKDKSLLEDKMRLQSRELQTTSKGLIHEIEERSRVEKMLQQTEKRLHEIFNNAPDAYYLTNSKSEILDSNSTSYELFNISKEEAFHKKVWDLQIFSKDDLLKILHLFNKSSEVHQTIPEVVSAQIDDKNKLDLELRITPLTVSNENLFLFIFRNITEQKKIEKEKAVIEEQFHRSQKMEAIGQLAGGVAHDFNNLLGAISGYAEMLKKKYAKDDEKMKKYLNTILSASERAADLTAQLLAFARKGKFQIAPVSVHELINEVTTLLEHTIDKRISIIKDFSAEKDKILCDKTQFHNALINIAVNARDAMPEGGELTFATKLAQIDNQFIEKNNFNMPLGEYLRISISDSGIGMEKELMDKIFEPFFTTKDPGKGTGLGLASVYGTVKSHNGAITVDSALNFGTTFHIFMPITENALLEHEKEAYEPAQGHGKILIVDDEEVLRDVVSDMLSSLGYSVLTCADGVEAIELYKKQHSEIGLVLLDIIMPRMDGYNCFRELKKINPNTAVIVTSGFTRDKTASKMIEDGAVSFIQKPFNMSNLAREIAHAFKTRSITN